MKQQLLTGAIAIAALSVNAQMVNDTVYVGAGYANNVWYSMSGDNQGSAPKNNWDIAFDASGFGSTVLINSVAGVMLWNYPNSDASGWASVDTTGLYTWPARYNSDTAWELGAMGRYADPSNDLDLDWGLYNMTTHVITGDSVYIIKLTDGSYKKLMIESLSGGTYTFKYANLDGTGAQNPTLAKSAYTGKNFGYYSLSSNTALDREPATANWDLFFGQYTTFIPSAYGVTGIQHNKGVRVAKCTEVIDKATFVAYGTASFKTAINTIGYNWKSFNGSAYDIKDSVVFFVEPANGEIWKMIMTGFGGSSNGGMMFSKEKLFTPPPAGVNGVAPEFASVVLYPNPANGGNVNVIYGLPTVVDAATLTVTDIAGRMVHTTALETAADLHQYMLNTSEMLPGMYLVTINAGKYVGQQKLVVRH